MCIIHDPNTQLGGISPNFFGHRPGHIPTQFFFLRGGGIPHKKMFELRGMVLFQCHFRAIFPQKIFLPRINFSLVIICLSFLDLTLAKLYAYQVIPTEFSSVNFLCLLQLWKTLYIDMNIQVQFSSAFVAQGLRLLLEARKAPLIWIQNWQLILDLQLDPMNNLQLDPMNKLNILQDSRSSKFKGRNLTRVFEIL